MAPDSPSFMARLYQVALDELFVQRLAERSGRALDNDTSGLQGGDLGVGVTLSSADNGTGVAHPPARRRRDTGNEADNGLVGRVVLLEEVGSVLLGSSTNLSNHDDAVCLAVLEEDLQAVDEVGSGEGVTADADNERLTKAGLGSLVDGLVGEGSGAGDDADATALVDEARHDADLALALGMVSAECILFLWVMRTGAMMPGQLGPTMRDLFWVLSMSVMRTMSGGVSAGSFLQVCCAAVPCWGMPSVMLHCVSSCVGRGLHAHVRHNQRDLSLDGLLNTGGGDGGTVGLSDGLEIWWARVRDEDGGRGRASLPDALLDIGEDGEAEVLLAGLLGVGASDDLCACASTSIAALSLVAARRLCCAIRRVAYRTRWPAVRGSCCRISAALASVAAAAARSRRGALHSRSLLAGEALEQHLGVAVDAQVLDGLGVLRRARCVRPGRGLGERRAHGLSDGLHGVGCSCWMWRSRGRGGGVSRSRGRC